MKVGNVVLCMIILLFCVGCASTGSSTGSNDTPRQAEASYPVPIKSTPPENKDAAIGEASSDIVETSALSANPPPSKHYKKSSKPHSEPDVPVQLSSQSGGSSAPTIPSSASDLKLTNKIDPKALARLSDPEIHEGHETLLTLVISPTKSLNELSDIISAQQQFTQVTADPSKAQDVNSVITYANWAAYKYIKAKIWHCPDFLECTSDDDVRETSNDPLIWNFLIQSKPINANESGFLGIKVYGDNDRNGNFNDEITSFPPLNPSIKVVHNLSWWQEHLESSDKVLDLIHQNLLALGAIITLLAGWITYLFKRKKT